MAARSIITSFCYGMKIAARVPSMALSWRSRRNRAKDQLKRELMAYGFEPHEARELSEMYPYKLGEMIQLARNTSAY
jgi:hypothetical protein